MDSDDEYGYVDPTQVNSSRMGVTVNPSTEQDSYSQLKRKHCQAQGDEREVQEVCDHCSPLGISWITGRKH